MGINNGVNFTANIMRFVLTFSFEPNEYSEIHKRLKNKKKVYQDQQYSVWSKDHLTGEVDLYHYIHNSLGEAKECLGEAWSYNINQEEKDGFHLSYVDIHKLGVNKPILFDINGIGLILFKSGVGFLWYSIDYKTKISDEIIETNYFLKELAKDSENRKNQVGIFRLSSRTFEQDVKTEYSGLDVLSNYTSYKKNCILTLSDGKGNKYNGERYKLLPEKYEEELYKTVLKACDELVNEENTDLHIKKKLVSNLNKPLEDVRSRIQARRNSILKADRDFDLRLSKEEFEQLCGYNSDCDFKTDVIYCNHALNTLRLIREWFIDKDKQSEKWHEYFQEIDLKRREIICSCCKDNDEFSKNRVDVEEWIDRFIKDNKNTELTAETLKKYLEEIDKLRRNLNIYKLKCIIAETSRLELDDISRDLGYQTACRYIFDSLEKSFDDNSTSTKEDDFEKFNLGECICSLSNNNRNALLIGLKQEIVKAQIRYVKAGFELGIDHGQNMIIYFVDGLNIDQFTIFRGSMKNTENKKDTDKFVKLDNRFLLSHDKYNYKSLFMDYLFGFLEDIPVISYFSDRESWNKTKTNICPDKAFLYSYVYIQSEDANNLSGPEKMGLIYRLGRCYNNHYEPNNQFSLVEENKCYSPFSYQTWFASKEGCTECIVAAPQYFNGNDNDFFAKQYITRIDSSFYLCILVLQQYYGLLRSNETIAKFSNNIETYIEGTEGKQLEDYLGQMLMFRMKNVFSQVSAITHINGFFQYLKGIFQIDEYMSEINMELDAVNGLVEKKAEKKRIHNTFLFTIIGAAFVVIQTSANILDLYTYSNFIQWLRNIFKGHFMSFVVSSETTFLFSVLGIAILICSFIYFVFLLMNRKK